MELQDLIGVPYESRGRSELGADCWGIIMLAAQHVYGQPVPDYSEYRDSTDRHQTEPLFEARRDWQQVPLDAIMPGDVIVLRLMGHPMHAAIYVGDGRMLHTMSGRDSCLDRLTSQGWLNRVEGVYRWVR